MMTKDMQKAAWRPVVESDGERLELKPGEPWDGVFLGVKAIPRTNAETGETEDAILVLLADAEDRRYNMWAGFALRKAIEHRFGTFTPVFRRDYGRRDFYFHKTLRSRALSIQQSFSEYWLFIIRHVLALSFTLPSNQTFLKHHFTFCIAFSYRT